MALGDNNNNNFNEPYRPTTYGYGFTNPDAKYEKTSLSFAIWKFMLKVTIAPKVNDGGTQNYDRYDKDNGISIYLNTNKAITLMRIVDEFKELYNKNVDVDFNKGVATNTGVIIISNGNYTGSNEYVPTITIAKVNENGNVTQMLNYEIKIGSDFAVLDYDAKTGKYTTETEPYAFNELELLHYQLEQYVLGQSGGIAGATNDAVNFAINRVRDDASKIAEKLGVDLHASNRSRNNYSRSSYFNNGGNSGESSYNQNSSNVSKNTTLEELGI